MRNIEHKIGSLNLKLDQVENFSKIDNYNLLKSTEKFIKKYPFPDYNQLCFLNTKNHLPNAYQGTGSKNVFQAKMFGLQEEDFTEFIPEFKGSIFHDIYMNFPLPVTRMRLMRVYPKVAYSLHKDGENEIRYHIAVKTNPKAFFVYGDTLDLIHVPADGNCYKFDVSRPHSFVNFHRSEERWHIVLNAKQ